MYIFWRKDIGVNIGEIEHSWDPKNHLKEKQRKFLDVKRMKEKAVSKNLFSCIEKETDWFYFCFFSVMGN
jgi:hypothetical protein